MGKINLDSIKSCLETANDSFKKMEEKRPDGGKITSKKESGDKDVLFDNVEEMMKNIPTFTQDKD